MEDFGVSSQPASSSGIARAQTLVRHQGTTPARFEDDPINPIKTDESRRQAAESSAVMAKRIEGGIAAGSRNPSVRTLIGVVADRINTLHQQVGLLEQSIDPVLVPSEHGGDFQPAAGASGGNGPAPVAPPPPFHIVAQLEICLAALDVVQNRVKNMQRRLVL